MQVDSIQLFPARIKSQTFSLHLNMDFAGPGGSRLSYLQRVVALIGGAPGLFRGLKFVYKDGESKKFTSNGICLTSVATMPNALSHPSILTVLPGKEFLQ